MIKQTYTEKGALAYKSTGDELLDLFALIGGLGYSPTTDEIQNIKQLIKHCLSISVKDTITLLFYLRDRTNGIGYRDVFVDLLAYTLNTITSYGHSTDDTDVADILVELVTAIPEYGRYDDIIKISRKVSTWKLREGIIRHIWDKFNEDYYFACLKNNDSVHRSVSLLGKWLPSINTSSKTTRNLARYLVNEFNKITIEPINYKRYRKMCSVLRNAINIVEHDVTEKTYEKINYSAVPSVAMSKYSTAFTRNDAERFNEFITKVKQGTAKLNAKLNVVDVAVRLRCCSKNDTDTIDFINVQWDNIPKIPCRSLVCMDGSGSMYCSNGQSRYAPIDVAEALTIYCAENNEIPAYKNKFITFGSVTKFVDLSDCATLKEKIDTLEQYDDCGTTNFVGMFKTILNNAKMFNVAPKDMLKSIIVISDMQFDEAFNGCKKTPLDAVKELYKENGYTLPKVIFWNICAKEALPICNDDHNTTILSGWSQNILQYIMENNDITPRTILDTVLQSSHYSKISEIASRLVYSDFDYL